MLRGSAGILLSRVSGLVRDIAAAGYWGATDIAQAAYSTAFSIPNSVRALLGEGAFAAAFVPLFSRCLEEKRTEDAWRLANRAISMQVAILLAMTVLGSAAAAMLRHSGLFHDDAGLASTILLILPLLLPYAVLICAAAALNAVLNSLKSFFLPNIIQMVFNFTQVAAVLYLACFWSNGELAALVIFCLSTSLAGLLEILMLLIACRRRGYAFHFDFGWRDGAVRQLVRNILPGLAGSGVNQLNGLLDKLMAAILGAGAIGALTYSQRLVYLPVGLFGVAMGMVCLPALSRATARHDGREIAESLDYAFRIVLFMSLPCVAFLAPCGREVIALFFQRGAFQQSAVIESSYALAFYTIGVPAFCCVKIAVTPFHARLDTRTPVKIAMLCMAVNLVLNLALMRPLRQGGLALATSASSWLNLALLMYFNRRQLPSWSPLRVLRTALALGVAALLAGIAARGVLLFCRAGIPGEGGFARNLLIAGASFSACASAYLAACLLLRRPEPREILNLFRRKLSRN